QYLLTANYALNRVDVWSLSDESWRYSIVDEVCRIEKAQWAPSGGYVLTFSELDLRLSIWSIEDPDERHFVQYPKSRVPPVFHPEGGFMAVAQRHDFRDYIGLYDTQTWTMVREIAVAETVDLAGLEWSPDGLHLVVWDVPANFCLVVVNVGGIVKRVYTEDEEGAVLGVRTCRWAPSAQLLAVAGCDQKVRLLSHLTWRPIATLVHRAQAIGPLVDVFVETEIAQESKQMLQDMHNSNCRARTRFVLVPTATAATHIQTVAPPASVGGGDVSVSRKIAVEFSADGGLLATVCETMPGTVWIWEIAAGVRLLNVIQTLRPVRSCVWSPVENSLVIATGSASIYLWKMGEGCCLYESPSETATAAAVLWNPNGDAIAVLCKGL
ncbi:hypothetical protein GGI21_006013, partial [Coemansia aciculifera]